MASSVFIAKKIILTVIRKMSWAEALKEYAKQRGQFMLPKKDSEEYKAVKAIQEKMSAKKQEPVAEEAPKKKRVRVEREGVVPKAAVAEECVKPKKKTCDPALACEEMKIKQAVKDQAPKVEEVKVKRVRKATKVAAPKDDAPARKPRVKKTEIIKKDVVMEF